MLAIAHTMCYTDVANNRPGLLLQKRGVGKPIHRSKAVIVTMGGKEEKTRQRVRPSSVTSAGEYPVLRLL